MIYTGSDEIRNIYLGNEEISAIYCGEDLIYPMSVTAWSVSPLTISAGESGTTQEIKIAAMDDWTITSSESWVTFSVTGGTSGRSRVEATIAANAGPQRTATITVADTGTTTALTIGVTQYVCNPLVLSNNLDNYNNDGKGYGSDFYLFDTGLTEVNPCTFDFTGIKSICCRADGFYDEVPVAALGNDSDGCLPTLESFEADCSTVEVLNFSFGADDFIANNLTSITLTNTDNVTEIGNFVYWCENLQSIKLGDLSNAVPANFGRIFGEYNTALTDFEVDALPNLDIDSNWGLDGCTALTVTSLVNILNALPQLSHPGRFIMIGSTNKNKLSAAQLAIATNKGWNVG